MYLKEITNLIGNYNFKNKKINKIRTDSRLLESDDIFITINSGNKYIDAAIKKGVSLIITDIEYDTNVPLIVVTDTIKVLGIIASYIRSKYNGTVIAITGSNGKTTTKELLSYILSTKYKVLKSIDSKNNHIGIPNILLELDNSYDYAVLELGTNHPGEIKYLADIVKPSLAIITNIGTSHIGNFKNKKNIFKEKLNIKDNNTLLFVNGEDKLLNSIDCIKVYKNDYEYIPDIKYYTMNYYLVFKVCEYLGLDKCEIYLSARSFKLSKSRMNKYIINGITLIDDSYNASFESVVEGILSLGSNRKIIVLGDMLELGSMSNYYHTKINNIIKKLDNYYLITIGKYTNIIESNIHFNDINSLENYLSSFVFINGDIIYVKGAHKMNLIQIVNYLKKNL